MPRFTSVNATQLFLPGSPSSPYWGRHFIGGILSAWEVDASQQRAAELVVSELVTNAVRVSPVMGCVVGLSPPDPTGHVVVEVWDASPDMPDGAAATGLAERGYGLGIVCALSSQWGACPVRPTGKIVWAKLAI